MGQKIIDIDAGDLYEVKTIEDGSIIRYINNIEEIFKNVGHRYQ